MRTLHMKTQVFEDFVSPLFRPSPPPASTSCVPSLKRPIRRFPRIHPPALFMLLLGQILCCPPKVRLRAKPLPEDSLQLGHCHVSLMTHRELLRLPSPPPSRAPPLPPLRHPPYCRRRAFCSAWQWRQHKGEDSSSTLSLQASP